MNNNLLVLQDWMSTPEMPFHSKITEDSDRTYHSHEFYEIFYILEGSIEHEVNGKTQTLHAGDIGFLNLTDVHSFLREPGNTCKHRDIIIQTDFFESVCEFLGTEFKHAYMNNLLPKIVSLPLDRMERYESRISNTISLSGMNTDWNISTIKALLVSLLNSLIEEEKQSNTQYYPMWFSNLLSRFHMNACLKSGLDDILRLYHFSKPYMCRTFQKYMGCTMTDYLNDIRLQQAAFQLQYTDNTILSICNEVGFSSISYFNTIFKRKYGMTPSAFRKQQKKISK